MRKRSGSYSGLLFTIGAGFLLAACGGTQAPAQQPMYTAEQMNQLAAEPAPAATPPCDMPMPTPPVVTPPPEPSSPPPSSPPPSSAPPSAAPAASPAPGHGRHHGATTHAPAHGAAPAHPAGRHH